jgi:hypothetical protein
LVRVVHARLLGARARAWQGASARQEAGQAANGGHQVGSVVSLGELEPARPGLAGIVGAIQKWPSPATNEARDEEAIDAHCEQMFAMGPDEAQTSA